MTWPGTGSAACPAADLASIAWDEPAGQFPRWLLAGQTRLSYRRAAEIFAAATRRLDPAGRSRVGWP